MNKIYKKKSLGLLQILTKNYDILRKLMVFHEINKFHKISWCILWFHSFSMLSKGVRVNQRFVSWRQNFSFIWTNSKFQTWLWQKLKKSKLQLSTKSLPHKDYTGPDSMPRTNTIFLRTLINYERKKV